MCFRSCQSGDRPRHPLDTLIANHPRIRAGAGRVWGSDDANVEGWKALKRLPGHDSGASVTRRVFVKAPTDPSPFRRNNSDVTDLAWSPKDRFLASVGLDNKVIIWCGYTLEPLRKLDLHQGFVKGVCWDPVGEFLATQSDDKSVKVWRTTDWGLEATITKPFEDSPGSTFFRRLRWVSVPAVYVLSLGLIVPITVGPLTEHISPPPMQ